MADLEDLKMIRIENTINSIGVGATVVLRHRSPPDRLCFITQMTIATEALVTVAQFAVRIDGEPFNQDTIAAGTTNFLIGQFNRTQNAVNAFSSGLMVPFRREVTIEAVNADIVARNLTWIMWAFVHQDREKKFQAEATLQGG